MNLHQVDYAIEFSDRIIGLKDGKLVFDGTPAELDAEAIARIYGTPYVKERSVKPQGFSDVVEADVMAAAGVA